MNIILDFGLDWIYWGIDRFFVGRLFGIYYDRYMNQAFWLCLKIGYAAMPPNSFILIISGWWFGT